MTCVWMQTGTLDLSVGLLTGEFEAELMSSIKGEVACCTCHADSCYAGA